MNETGVSVCVCVCVRLCVCVGVLLHTSSVHGQRIHLHFISAWSYKYACAVNNGILLLLSLAKKKKESELRWDGCPLSSWKLCLLPVLSTASCQKLGRPQSYAGFQKRDTGGKTREKDFTLLSIFKAFDLHSTSPFSLNQIRSVHSNTLSLLFCQKWGKKRGAGGISPTLAKLLLESKTMTSKCRAVTERVIVRGETEKGNGEGIDRPASCIQTSVCVCVCTVCLCVCVCVCVCFCLTQMQTDEKGKAKTKYPGNGRGSVFDDATQS